MTVERFMEIGLIRLSLISLTEHKFFGWTWSVIRSPIRNHVLSPIVDCTTFFILLSCSELVYCLFLFLATNFRSTLVALVARSFISLLTLLYLTKYNIITIPSYIFTRFCRCCTTESKCVTNCSELIKIF